MRRSLTVAPWLAVLAGTLPLAAEEPPCRGRGALVEIAAEAGITFVHDRGATGHRYNPETMGSGVAWLDYDGDGWWDLYLVQSGPLPADGSAAAENRLFRNLGNGRFSEVTAASGAGERGYGQGVLAADADGDGWTDLYLANYGPDRLLVNRGDGTFVDRTEAAGLAVDGWSSAAALADTDGDGDLDLYVTRYVVHSLESEPFCTSSSTGERWYCGPSAFEGEADLFFRNEGGGRFVDATSEAGFGSASGKGLGVLMVDLDGDHLPEVYVANDMTVNFLFANLGDGRFEDLSLLSGSAVNREGMPEAGMGVAMGDVDGDGDGDLVVTNYDVQTNTLYLNGGDLQFEDVSATSGFGPPSFNLVGFGLVLADFDRDGRLDAHIANGHTVERPARANVDYAQLGLMLLGEAEGRFRSEPCLLPAVATVARGSASGDLDNDGAPDLAIQHSGGPAWLLHNRLAGGSWLGLRLVGGAPNPEAVGAELRLAAGNAVQRRWVIAGDSYQSTSDRRVLFGLEAVGEASLEVRWPRGRRQRFADLPADRYLTLPETP
jgi:hypothetical protein